jgi:signal transduction histidine kinase
VIHGELVRVEQTVQGLLDFARPPVPRRSTCDLRQVVDSAMELVRARARQQKVSVEIAVPNHAMPADVDQGQWYTVLVNLLLNALDAMPQGGCLKVALENPAEEEIRLTVSDTGGGIPREMLGRLFVPFASTKPTGTGLGLSISRRIIEEHGGKMTGENRPEGGASFTIQLPITAEEAVHAHALGH